MDSLFLYYLSTLFRTLLVVLRDTDGRRFAVFFPPQFFFLRIFLNFFLPRARTPSGLLPSSQTVRAHPHYPRTLPLCHLLSLGGSRRIFLNFFVRLLLFLQAASKCVYTHSTTFCGYPRTHTRFLHVLPARWHAIYNATSFCEKVFFCCSLVATVFCSLRTRDYASQLHTHQLRWNKPIPPCNTSGKAFKAVLQSDIFSSCPGINF